MKNEQNEHLTKLINKNKLKQAKYQMQNDKSPGIFSVLRKKHYKHNETSYYHTYSKKRRLK